MIVISWQMYPLVMMKKMRWRAAAVEVVMRERTMRETCQLKNGVLELWQLIPKKKFP
jgi:hypothetical protein